MNSLYKVPAFKKFIVNQILKTPQHTDLLENGLEDMGRGWGEM